MSPAQCDILIVGAGPAGATAAFIRGHMAEPGIPADALAVV